MPRQFFPTALFLLLFGGAQAQPANPQACAGCHGARGEGGSTGGPALAGQPQAYLVRQLDAYADGRRQHAVMSPIARGLRPEEREELAAYYARLQPPARPPQLGSYKNDGGRDRLTATKRVDSATVDKNESPLADSDEGRELGHELGNLLAPIRNALRLMSHKDVDPHTVEYARGVIEKQLGELEALSNRLTGSSTAQAVVEGEVKGRRRIMVVDDNRAWVDSLCSVLRNEGYTVYPAYGGREAVQQAAEVKPDVVLLDIEMPEMSGYETARRLRQNLPGHPVQIIAVTVWGRESDRAAARLAGFNNHLTKPLIFDQLAKVLH